MVGVSFLSAFISVQKEITVKKTAKFLNLIEKSSNPAQNLQI